MNYDVFISYAEADGRSFAEASYEYLTADRLSNVAYAPRTLENGDDLDATIRDGIDRSRIVMFILTPKALESNWVSGEITYALNANKRLLIFCKSDVQPPIRLTSKKWETFSTKEELIKQLSTSYTGIPVIVPSAGLGTGLYPFNRGMPKLLMPVHNKPILHHIADTLDTSLFSGITILTGQFHEMIDYYARLSQADIPIRCIPSPAETLPQALCQLGIKGTFLLHYSDIVLTRTPNWTQFITQHKGQVRQNSVLGTLTTSRHYPLHIGQVISERDPNLIDRFDEKPEATPIHHRVNMAVSLLEPEFLNQVRAGDTSVFGHTVARAIELGKQFAQFWHDDWLHIQTLSDWYAAQEKYFFAR